VAFSLQLPKALRKARWKAKIRDRERCEHPHVTIIRGTQAWRINLRTGMFLEDDPNPADVPDELMTYIKDEQTWKRLCDEWNRLYPNNVVSSDVQGEEQDNDE